MIIDDPDMQEHDNINCKQWVILRFMFMALLHKTLKESKRTKKCNCFTIFITHNIVSILLYSNPTISGTLFCTSEPVLHSPLAAPGVGECLTRASLPHIGPSPQTGLTGTKHKGTLIAGIDKAVGSS